jgi:3-(3-hydroxy-phenyl)propionate hydroxylase
MPSFLTGSVLNTPDADTFEGNMVPGAPMDDAPVQVDGQDAWLLDQVGKGFQLMLFLDVAPDAQTLAALQALKQYAVPVDSLIVSRHALQVTGFPVLVDAQGWMAKRYDAQPGTTYLLRPDQHVLARWRSLDSARLQTALARALGQVGEQA